MSSNLNTTGEHRIPLPFVKAAWVIIISLILALYLISLPHMFAHGQTICNRVNCSSIQLSPTDLRQLQQAGLSLRFYAIFTTVLDIVYTLVFAVVAAIIFWRKPDDRMAVYASLALVFFAVAVFITPLDNLETDVPRLLLPLQLIQVISASGFVVFFYLFPDGRFVPGWIRWLIPFVIARETLNIFAPQLLGPDWFFVLELGSIIFAQVYRYKRVSTPLQRQQTKWAVFGMVAMVFMVIVLVYGGYLLFARLARLGFIIFPTVMYLATLLLPLSFGMAILRSHLWDIDIIIRRTILYGALTLLLALVYAGLVVSLQHISAVITGQPESPVAIVLSTLAIAALFSPLRYRLQRWIDRRFYRQQYDPEKVLVSFRSIAQNEVDLTRLSGGFIDIVETTVQPDSLALWLRPPAEK